MKWIPLRFKRRIEGGQKKLKKSMHLKHWYFFPMHIYFLTTFHSLFKKGGLGFRIRQPIFTFPTEPTYWFFHVSNTSETKLNQPRCLRPGFGLPWPFFNAFSGIKMCAKETMNNLPPHTVKVDYHFCNCAWEKGKRSLYFSFWFRARCAILVMVWYEEEMARM